MAGTKSTKQTVELESMKADFAQWRRERPVGQRIPKHLWEAAEAAAVRHGIHRVSQAAGLGYGELKRRVELLPSKQSKPIADPVFVELSPLAESGGQTCLVELEKANGTKLRVEVSDAATVDWACLKEAFLGG